MNALLVESLKVLPSTDRDAVKPLAVGIWAAIAERRRPEVSLTELRKALGCYANCTAYLRAVLREGSMRHDIDGAPVVSVSDDDRKYAAERLQARAAKARKRQPATS